MSPCLVVGRAKGVGVDWQPLIEFLVSVGYGLLSSLVPIFNSEIYIVASQVGGFTEEVTTAVGCAVDKRLARLAPCSPSAVAVVPVWRDGYGGDGSVPASRPVAFGPGSGPGRTGSWDSWVNAGGGRPSSSSPPVSPFRRCMQ